MSLQFCRLSARRGVQVVRGDAESVFLPFKSGVMDTVFMGGVIEYLFDPDHLLLEIRRVMKPGGSLVLTTQNLACLINRGILLLGFQPFHTHASFRHGGAGKIFSSRFDECGPNIRPFTLRALSELLRLNGFEVVKLTGLPFGVFRRHGGIMTRLFHLMDRIASRKASLASTLIAHARSPSKQR